ncbi:hypothetical protein TWF694_002977 [Orbilia ellipsospora]|uniref:Phytase A n=1 Tax=Orbilia ellipsospora TaxID=2528407 RepID=A0AAV9X071_9PEZI
MLVELGSLVLPIALLIEIASGAVILGLPERTDTCTSLSKGYICHKDISRSWGAYSPYHALTSPYKDSALPSECKVTFAQVLSRHASRYPTRNAGDKLKATLDKIQSKAKSYSPKTEFIKKFEYDLQEGYDMLTEFGKGEMYRSGEVFFHRYKHLAKEEEPFVRVAGQQRVVDSGNIFMKGFTHAKKKYTGADKVSTPEPVIIYEGEKFKNVLDHSACKSFETGKFSQTYKKPMDEYAAVFTPPIIERLKGEMPGSEIDAHDVESLMGLCSFYTVVKGVPLSKFCHLFTPEEFKQYNYFRTLGFYYRFGPGNELGPAQGIGFVNELIARLTNSKVKDYTTSNATTVGPLDKKIYADFSHDTTMITIFSAMQLFDGLKPLNTKSIDAEDRFNAAELVPFASRMYVEKLKCEGEKDDLVRVLINERVMKLKCKEKKFGGCTVKDFVGGLEFARTGGNWVSCGPTHHA